jgi:hypothetical protein
MSRTARRARVLVKPKEVEPETKLSMADFEDAEVKEDKEVKEVKFREEREVAVDVVNPISNLWFIADFKMDKNIQKQLSAQYSNIQDWNRDNFANRPPAVMLKEFEVQHLWTDISNTHALKYVKQYIKENSTYTTVLIHRSRKNSKHQKWIADLMAIDGAIDIKLQSRDIAKISSLTLSGLIEQIDGQIELHAPAGGLGLFTCLTSALVKGKDRLK